MIAQERPGLRIETSEERYVIEAPTFSALVAQLNETRLEGPRARLSQGLTEYHIVPEWRAMASGGTCRVTSVTVSVEITITLPHWSDVDGRPPEDRERWALIERAIRDHEYYHRDLTIEAAGELLDSIRGREARGCNTLQQVVRSLVSVAEGRLEEAHATFDREAPKRFPIGDGRPG